MLAEETCDHSAAISVANVRFEEGICNTAEEGVFSGFESKVTVYPMSFSLISTAFQNRFIVASANFVCETESGACASLMIFGVPTTDANCVLEVEKRIARGKGLQDCLVKGREFIIFTTALGQRLVAVVKL